MWEHAASLFWACHKRLGGRDVLCGTGLEHSAHCDRGQRKTRNTNCIVHVVAGRRCCDADRMRTNERTTNAKKRIHHNRKRSSRDAAVNNRAREVRQATAVRPQVDPKKCDWTKTKTNPRRTPGIVRGVSVLGFQGREERLEGGYAMGAR